MAQITRFYVGLSDENMENQEVEPSEVVNSISDMVVGGTLLEAKGLWKGVTENTVVIEVVDVSDSLTEEFEESYSSEIEESSASEVIKERLEKEFNQESVMTVKSQADVMF